MPKITFHSFRRIVSENIQYGLLFAFIATKNYYVLSCYTSPKKTKHEESIAAHIWQKDNMSNGGNQDLKL